MEQLPTPLPGDLWLCPLVREPCKAPGNLASSQQGESPFCFLSLLLRFSPLCVMRRSAFILLGYYTSCRPPLRGERVHFCSVWGVLFLSQLARRQEQRGRGQGGTRQCHSWQLGAEWGTEPVWKGWSQFWALRPGLHDTLGHPEMCLTDPWCLPKPVRWVSFVIMYRNPSLTLKVISKTQIPNFGVPFVSFLLYPSLLFLALLILVFKYLVHFKTEKMVESAVY